ncbi:hypothetical protein BC628DRAFT_1182504 [Trametes gibbosa]|nr:hypothetical protein BC628DRAFT_1182504 [Trametes gibbosa]
MIIDSAGRELELRAHIHSLLSKYVSTHLATDYVSWTQAEVAHCLTECLYLIPLTERTAIALPLDPFDLLSQEWNLDRLDVFEEKWKVTDKDVVSYLQQQMAALQSRREGADGHWRNHDDPEHDALLLRRPISPILSARARLGTPRLGKGDFTAKLPQSVEDMSRMSSVNRVKEIIIKEDPVNVEEVLANKLPMDTETHRNIMNLMQRVPGLTRASTASVSRHIDGFLRSESPPLDLLEPDLLPIFPRSERLDPASGEKHSALGIFKDMAQLPGSILSPAKMREEDEEDFADAHLVVVDGWQAFRTSSPSTPSLANSSSDVDELFIISSPRSEMLCADRLQMEEPQMPRSKRIGATYGEQPRDARDRLSEFLPVLIRPAKDLRQHIVHSPKSQASSPRASLTLSMLGQAPTVLDVPVTVSDIALPSSDDTIAFAVKTIERSCGDGLGSEDPANLILKEKLDEKDSMLMDVPIMQPPNEHPAGHFLLPARLTDLLAPHMASTGTNGMIMAEEMRHPRVLKKAKGLQPLQIELSWIPFKYGRTVPTDEEVADVQNDPCPQLAKSIDLAQNEIVAKIATLLDDSMAFGSQPTSIESPPSSSVWLADQETTCNISRYADFEDGPLIILTRFDNTSAAHLSSTPDGLSIMDGDKPSSLIGATDAPERDPILTQITDTYVDVERPAKRVRFRDLVIQETIQGKHIAEDPHDYAEDSGIFVEESDSEARMFGDRSSFGQLANDSEGFEGLTTDGDLFPDFHPLYSGYYPLSPTPGVTLPAFIPSSDLISPCLPFTKLDVLCGDGRRVEEDERVDAQPPLYQPIVHDRQFILPLATRPLPAPSGSSTAVASTLAGRDPVTVGSALPDTSDVRGFVRNKIAPASVMSARHSLDHFLAICGKGSLATSSDALDGLAFVSQSVSPTPGVTEVLLAPSPPAYRTKEAPSELINNLTLILPAQPPSPKNCHRYMASLDLIQKRALVRALASLFAVDLVEREHMGFDVENVHLILDCDTAVLFVSVETLPSCGHVLMMSLTKLSWRFLRLLVVFECYPSSWSYKGDEDFANKHVASVWSPSVVKAVKRLRRDLAIADGTQTKRAATDIVYAFASTTQEAAAFARMYGDAAASLHDSAGAFWTERTWLTHDERDGEYDLCRVDGMNLFAASLLLSQTTLEDFLEKNADERLLEYGDLVGTERMTRFNVEMARRLEAMRLPPSSPIDADTSLSSDGIGHSECELY